MSKRRQRAEEHNRWRHVRQGIVRAAGLQSERARKAVQVSVWNQRRIRSERRSSSGSLISLVPPTPEKSYPVGPKSAKTLGYSPDEIDGLPPSATESFAGVGNPFSLGELHAGQIVLDLGCGAGMDALLAARKIGPSGRVVGVDITEEMILKARNNAERPA